MPLYSRKSYIRSLKNHIITLIALVSRTAIEGGVTVEEAISLSDSYILNLEESSKVDEIRMIARDMLYTFTTKVKEVEGNKYSKIINECREYIFKNIYTTIQNEEISKHVAVSPTYLSALFKKETGYTFTDYIQKEKIRESKQLLDSSNLSLSEIATYLSFSDQSYFSKTFKKHTGLSPNKYRKEI